MPSDDIKFVLRIPKELDEEIRRKAEGECLSLNSWIIRELEGSDGLGKVERPSASSDMSRVRSGVRDDSGNKGPRRGSGAATVQRPSNKPSSDAGAVGGGARQDTGVKGVCERPYLGPAHMKGCGCASCRTQTS